MNDWYETYHDDIADISFFHRYLNCWNALPVYVRQSSSLTLFKRHINLLDLRKYLKESSTDIN